MAYPKQNLIGKSGLFLPVAIVPIPQMPENLTQMPET